MTTPPEPQSTHFGFEQVATNDKARRVRGVFDSVAVRYDLMNDLMSLGVHRLWKRMAVDLAEVRPGQQILDLAAGTGDIASALAKRAGATGRVIAADINAAMLNMGRDRLIDRGHANNIVCVQANAECLPFADNSFDCITMAFGLRNVTDKSAALASMLRVLRPGGRLLVLEFSHPTPGPVAALYDLYSFRVLPLIGKVVAGDEGSYRYLAESIRMHPPQSELQAMMETAGFAHCTYLNVSTGIVAIHRGYKL
ncbi:MAG: bifunctional demethylmenaquinone methyltransferase/2-methoxy-6-polyprenyl-1,4-benzoquinol methylase UbiE [Chromatiales bacterium]|jgi:demethylmenaquinone methyltransferase/2-methoxy-6-polyprenyl-1,4-benzoquinol methylase|nr:bifunctional demethylmenaquinone methyltransferase/2-methoxy-6-polyprenyl-1,4-benzoquinol methylase UbiE [Chromatiales bacterium]